MSDSRLITRRRAVLGGMAALGALALPGCSKSVPPTYGNLLRMADNLNWASHRALFPDAALAKEYSVSEISSILAIGTTNPGNSKEALFHPELGAQYDVLRHGGFADWRLSVEGAVERPRALSLEELKRMPARTQITKHTCEEGWSAIAQWTGVPLRAVLEAVGTRPSARFVNFHPFDAVIDSIDMVDALHPQTILAYGMNGRDLPIAHGAPLRVRVEKQLGYKSMKFLNRIWSTRSIRSCTASWTPRSVGEHATDSSRLQPVAPR